MPADIPAPDSPIQGLLERKVTVARPGIINQPDADAVAARVADAAARLRGGFVRPARPGLPELLVKMPKPPLYPSTRPAPGLRKSKGNPNINTQLKMWMHAPAPEGVARRRAAMQQILQAQAEARPTLSLCFQELSSLPDCLSAMPALRRLDIAGNRLKRLPPLPSGLLALDASRNLLVNGSLTLSPCMQQLNLRENALTALPALPPTLTHLEAGRNRLTALPQSLPPALVFLEAGHNTITRMPPTLPQNLREICMEHNNLSSIGQLPASVVQADFDDNALEALPIGLSEGLRHLSVARNRIARIPGSLPSSLAYADLSGNRLTHVPPALWQLGKQAPVLPRAPDEATDIAKGIERTRKAGISGNRAPLQVRGSVSPYHEIHLQGNPLDVSHEKAVLEARIAAGHVVPELNF